MNGFFYGCSPLLRHRSGQASALLKTGFDRLTGSRLRVNGNWCQGKKFGAFARFAGMAQRKYQRKNQNQPMTE
jgi:hypothetical protein